MNYGINQQYPPHQLPPSGLSNMGPPMAGAANMNNPPGATQNLGYGNGQPTKQSYPNNIPQNQSNGSSGISQQFPPPPTHQSNMVPTQQNQQQYQQQQMSNANVLPPPSNFKQPNLENNNVVGSQGLQNGQPNYFSNVNNVGQQANVVSSQQPQQSAPPPARQMQNTMANQQQNMSPGPMPNQMPTQQPSQNNQMMPPPPLSQANGPQQQQQQQQQNSQQGSRMPPMPPMPQQSQTPTNMNQPGLPKPNQQRMTPMSQQGMPQMQPPSANQQPGMPPMGQQSGMPPMIQQPGMPPMAQQQGMPPMAQQPGMPPMAQQPGMPPMTQQPGMPPMNQQPGIPPIPRQQGMPPMPQPAMQAMQQSSMPPMSQPGMPPMSQPGIPPLQQPGMPPIQQPGMPPMSQPGMPPMPSQGMNQQYQNPNMMNPQQQPYMNQQQFANQGGMNYPAGPGMPPPGMQQKTQMGQMGQMGRPGQQPQYNMYGSQMPPQQNPPAQRRLDPDQMPNPIQVMAENQKSFGGVFATNNAGALPPLVTTKFIIQDHGNSSPRYIRSSIYCVPSTSESLKATALPFTLILSPFANVMENEMNPPVVDFGELGPIRCIRCKAYMSPNMQFIDAGRRFQCVLCKATTEVPSEYFQHLDHTGQRIDKFERPELVLGTYEFVATKDYCRDTEFPNPPAYIFVIDVSYNNVKNGLVKLLCSEIKSILKNLPIDENQDVSKIKVGFITFNSVVHFYNIKSTLTQPQMMIVGDAKEMFMPLLDGFLCDPEESALQIDSLLEQVSTMFENTKETECILYPAVQAGIEALKASKCPGKLFVFQSSLPVSDVPGKLKNRDDRKVLGTDKEKSVLSAQNSAYAELAKEAVAVGCSVDLFIFNNSYIDLATIGQLARFTGGEVYKYTYFQADIDGQRLIKDLAHNVSRPTAFDAVMRVRTSTGVRPTEFYGHYYMSNTTDLELASIDAEKSIAIEIKHDDKLPPEENVYIQVALLYTSCSGQRRLRINNLALRTVTTIADVFKACDLDALILFLAKQSTIKLLEHSPKIVKDHLIQVSAQILACYRKHCTSPTSAGQLILPECLKLLPLYVSCMLKNDSISGGSDMTCDDRSYVMQRVLSFDLPASTAFFYPRLIPIHDLSSEDRSFPSPIRCSYEKMTPEGAYILENGMYLFIWLGGMLTTDFIKDLFGVSNVIEVSQERLGLRNDTDLSQRVWDIINEIMSERKKSLKITIIKQQDKLETVYRHFLVEDRGCDGTLSYVDFLCHMHKEIKELLN